MRTGFRGQAVRLDNPSNSVEFRSFGNRLGRFTIDSRALIEAIGFLPACNSPLTRSYSAVSQAEKGANAEVDLLAWNDFRPPGRRESEMAGNPGG